MLRLLLGRAGSGKTTYCFKDINKELHRERDGPALVYLVPEQATFQAELTLSTMPGLGGSIRAQVLSFRRLAWKVLQETGGGRRVFVDDTGKGIIMRRVLEKHKESLKIFRHAGERPGLIAELVRLYNELRRARISVFQLKEYLSKQEQKQDKERLLWEKLREVALIMEAAEHDLSTHYVDAEDYLLLLAMKLPRSSFMQGALVWVDGFYGFTQLEFLILESLLRQGSKITVTLCLPRDYSLQETIDELDPFYTSGQTCQRLQQIAFACGVDIEKIFLPESKGKIPYRFQHNAPLAHLESHLHVYPPVPYTGKEVNLPIRLLAAANRRVEVEGAAREIIALVRDYNYRFREIAVMTHCLEEYGDLIVNVFNSCGIPFFLDQKRAILHHPLVEFIRSSLEVVNGNWQKEPFFRCIKSGFLFPANLNKQQQQYWREQAARLENYVIAFGIKGASWKPEVTWRYLYREAPLFEHAEDKPPSQEEAAFLEEINKVKLFFSAPLLRFQEEFTSNSQVKGRVRAIHNLLQAVSAEKHIQLFAEQARLEGDPVKYREQEQVFKGVMDLLEQLVEMSGDDNVSVSLFTRLIEAGFSALRLGLAPPSLDQVIVGNLARTRLSNVRALFLLGVNDGVLPARPAGEAIFSEKEREILVNQGFSLFPGPQRRLLDEEFLIYLSFSRASEKLYISYALADETGKALLPSILISRLQELFPLLEEQLQTTDPEMSSLIPGREGETDVNIAKTLLSFVFHPRQTLSYLIVQLGRWKEGRSMHPLWWEVYNWYAWEDWKKKEWAKQLLKGIFYRNLEFPLTSQTSRELYGQTFQTSTTRLELFRRCPFAHFAAYGLRLQQRRQYSLEAFDIGRFFHAALYNVARNLQKQGRRWGEWGKDDLLNLVSTEVAILLPRLRQEIMLSTRRYEYLARRMEETVRRAVLFLAEHDRRSEFIPFALEVEFGVKGQLPPLRLELESGSTVEVIGRIDRIDVAQTEEGRTYVRIIDYKSGNADLNLMELFYGLNLQLVVYLDAVLAHAERLLGKTALPAGLFYFHVYDPIVNSSSPMTPQMIELETLKRFKLNGIMLADPSVVRLMDKELKFGYSSVVPAALNKKGEVYGSGKSLVKSADFETLCCHVRSIIKETASAILQGCLEISPVCLGQKKACSYCIYKAVCQFDVMFEENRYRKPRNIPEKLGKEMLFQYMGGEKEIG